MLPLVGERTRSHFSIAVCIATTLISGLGRHDDRLIVGIMTEACEREARSLALEKAYVHQVYQQISDATDALPDRGRAWPKVKQFLADLEPGSLVCDVGCGNGKYLDANPSVFEIGVDRCKRLTEVAREKDHEVLICDNLALPFRDESFDAVLSIAVIHHFATTDRRVQALRELARVLKIGGRLIISVWAMEQRHRKFESQDVLVPWHRPQQLSTPSLEFTSTTTTTTTSEDDGPPPYHAYTQTSDSESTRSQRGNYGVRKRGRSWHKGRSIDPSRPLSSSQSSSSLSSPNETCYSFVRRALQKLAGGKRGTSRRHRPWFLDSWTTCTKEPPSRRYDPDGCEDNDVEDIQDLPIELRRLEEDPDLPQRRQTFACSEKLSSIEISLGYKSKSLSDILTVNQRCLVRSRSSASNLGASSTSESIRTTTPATAAVATTATATTTTATATATVTATPTPTPTATAIATATAAKTTATATTGTGTGTGTTTTTTTSATSTTATATATTSGTKAIAAGVITSQPKPKLVKQKQSLCEEEMEEAGGDLPTDMKDLVKRLPDFKISVSGGTRRQGNVFKQSSMNEELMSTERLREKEMVRQNIQKQASLNEEILFRRQRTFDSIRDTFFSTSTARRFQILKDGLTSKIKNSTTGIEKVAGASFKNGFVRILQGWKSEPSPTYPTTKPTPATPPPCEIRKANCAFEEKATNGNGQSLSSGGERRHSKEDGSDSSKDSSLQSDTSVDSEDSFASVIFVPKPEPTSETSPPTNTSPPSVALTSPTFHSLPQSPQPTSPKLKGSLPPSPKFKYQSPTSPVIKQPSLPCKYQSPTSPNLKMQIPTSPIGLAKQHSLPTSPKFKYAVPPLSPSFNRAGDAQLNFQHKLSMLSCQQKTSPCPSATSSRQGSLEADAGVGGEPPNPPSRTSPSATEMPTVQIRVVQTQSPEQLPRIEEPKEEMASEDRAKETREQAVAVAVKSESQLHSLEASKLKTGMHPRQCFPIVRRSFATAGTAGRQENLAKPLPKLLSLELFNPETDDVDSDSSGVSSPDSISSVISVLTEELSVESHDAQQTKRSPSDGHSNSNSANDSDLNLSDQSLSSLPNSKSPECLGSKSPENTSKSAEKSKSSDVSSSSRTSEAPTPADASKSSSKSAKSPETLSSSSDSLSKSPDLQKESEDSKSDETARTEHSSEVDEDESKSSSSKHGSSKSPDFLSVKHAKPKAGRNGSSHREKMVRKRDEKFVTAACEMEEESSSSPPPPPPFPSTTTTTTTMTTTTARRSITSRSLSPSKSLIEAVADVASSLEGAVDAVIRSSPGSKRRRPELWVESGAESKVAVAEDFSPGGASRISPDREEASNLSNIFKKCEVKGTLKIRHRDIGRKKSPEYLPSRDEPYPDFEFCKIKCHEDKPRRPSLERYRSERSVSIENMPLLGSYEHESGLGSSYDGETSYLSRSEKKRLSKERSRAREPDYASNMPRSIETGSSWSLGRSERFYQSQREAEREERRRNSSTWSLNRYNSVFKADSARNAPRGSKPDAEPCESTKKWEHRMRTTEKPTVRITREDSSPSGESSSAENRRSARSHSLGGRVHLADADDRFSDSWGEEYRQNLADFADRLSEKLAEEIDQYREEANSKHIYSSLPSGLELMDDPYLTRLSAQLLDLNRLSAELKERNTYLASLSDEDVNKDRSSSKPRETTNPFLSDSPSGGGVGVGNPFSAPERQRSNPFLTDDSESERSKSDESDAGSIGNRVAFEDSFVPLEIDSPPKSEDRESAAIEGDSGREAADEDKRLVEGIEERSASEERSSRSPFDGPREPRSATPSAREKRKSLLFVKSASLDDSYKFLGKSNVGGKKSDKSRNDGGGKTEKKMKKETEGRGRTESSIARAEETKKTAPSLESSRSPGKTHSTESADLDSGSRKSTRIPSWESSVDTDPGSGIQRDLSKITIASSLGYSMESSDPEASGGTGSGSDCSRRDASRVTASTTSLGHSIESSDPGDVSERTGSGSDFSKKETSSAETGRTADSTASLGPESGSDCSKDTGYADRRKFRCDGRSSSEETPRRIQLVRQKSTVQEPPETPAKSESFDNSLNGSTSQVGKESLPSDNGGGAITFHRFYHVFREGELDQLIEKYVDNLHIISSYYDHANWCVIAEKVQVWTI